jgi:hypothetical protein
MALGLAGVGCTSEPERGPEHVLPTTVPTTAPSPAASPEVSLIPGTSVPVPPEGFGLYLEDVRPVTDGMGIYGIPARQTGSFLEVAPQAGTVLEYYRRVMSQLGWRQEELNPIENFQREGPDAGPEAGGYGRWVRGGERFEVVVSTYAGRWLRGNERHYTRLMLILAGDALHGFP